ncbi:MAG: aminodeoxychorismate synthase, component I [Gammaproteobacteria bacterium RIFCSPHIGHO2_12_FULL_45_9]|nr:MAG: aminodeoxychorismate synthase, component I [Gammaproteobacteria bacterium RIFCSPHIGHO2_12_FULL_45_9]
MSATCPLSVEIPYEDPAILFKAFSDQPWAFLLDSADANRPLDDTNRFSYIAFDPFETIVIKDGARIGTTEMIHNPFQYVRDLVQQYQLAYQPHLPLLQGGAIGYFSYDLCHYLEDINRPQQKEETAFADLALGLFDLLISFDHVLQKAWIISCGFPEKTPAAQWARAKLRLAACLERLSAIGHDQPLHATECEKIDLISSCDQEAYAARVRKAQAYIREGDIFEVNLSHRFQAMIQDKPVDPYTLYLSMRHTNPSPFSAYLNLDDHHILSTSPERFLSLTDQQVSTRPIKGTAPRGKTPEEDQAIADALLSSEKDRSENVMIVDLLRNDLSKVCTASSVTVKKLCGLESYPTVHHLVSVIEGTLQQGFTAFDLLAACFPGGSVTGAPKIRAMQIIYELEPTERGPYCGSIGFVGFNGVMDTSIVIRTLLYQNNMLSYQAGGAIVLDSCPEGEYEETLVKSRAIKRALASWCQNRRNSMQ